MSEYYAEDGTRILLVASTSEVKKVAGAIANILRTQPKVMLQAIGVNAVYRATKSSILAQRFLDKEGIRIEQHVSYEILTEDIRPGYRDGKNQKQIAEPVRAIRYTLYGQRV